MAVCVRRRTGASGRLGFASSGWLPNLDLSWDRLQMSLKTAGTNDFSRPFSLPFLLFSSKASVVPPKGMDKFFGSARVITSHSVTRSFQRSVYACSLEWSGWQLQQADSPLRMMHHQMKSLVKHLSKKQAQKRFLSLWHG